MQSQSQINRQLFANRPLETQIDKDRIALYKLIQASKEEEKPEDKLKKVINPNLFRQEVRRQQRDFHQQNHQFLKMSGIVARYSREDNRFNYFGDNFRKTNTFAKGNTNSKNIQRKVPTVHLSLDTVEFSCALVLEKVPIKDLYQMFPFKKQSILFQSHEFLNPEYIFFFQQNGRQAADNLKHKLQNTIEEGISAQFKSSINKAFKHITFFDYLYFLNRKTKPQKQLNYPAYINQIAMNNTNFLEQIEEDERDKFNRQAIHVQQQDTCERLIIGEETDVGDNGQNLCFDNIQKYTEYKEQKAIDFKFQKIFQKDAIINTNIRNIISTQKIYLVEIIEEVKSYILLSKQCEGTTIMDKVYQHLTDKADQYLRLLCGYTQSKILTIYNIENYQEKIYQFIEKSIRFKKEIRNIPQWVIKQYPVLQIWFKLPENLLGYSREELHECFYQLMEAIIEFQNKMKNSKMYEELKIKRQGIKYIK